MILVSTAEFTRPADTTAYAANDSVNSSTSSPALIEFPTVVPAQTTEGIILAVRGFVQGASFNTTLRLHLYTVSTVTAINDNAAFTLLWANRSNRIGYVDLTGWTSAGTGSDSSSTVVTGVNLPFNTIGKTSIYGAIEARAAFTPTSGQGFHFTLKTIPS